MLSTGFWRPRRLVAVSSLVVVPMFGGLYLPEVVDEVVETTAATQAEPVLAGGREDRFDTEFVPMLVEPQTTLVWRADRNREVRVDSERGSRVWTVSALASHDLPSAALSAYRDAAVAANQVDPSCQMPWTLLAGIGRVESDHGRYGGSQLSTDGVSRPAIIGVALNGVGPVAAIRDTDRGRLDRDKVWDRAVGPMQFIPSTWSYSGRDGDGDGRKNPHDLDDAALAAATYLCSGSGSMLDPSAAASAIFRYNPSDYYVDLVQAFERGYRTGVFVIPSPAAPVAEPSDGARPSAKDRDRRPKKQDAPAAAKPGKPAPKPTPKPASKPSPKPPVKKPSKPGGGSSPSPSPSPAPPAAPKLVALNGQLSGCGGGWCVGGTALDLGPGSQLSSTAAHDYDGDGAVETNAQEFDGLVGTSVSLQVAAGSGTVYVVNGKGYRNADGSFA